VSETVVGSSFKELTKALGLRATHKEKPLLLTAVVVAVTGLLAAKHLKDRQLVPVKAKK
jgi:hypothetical protein